MKGLNHRIASLKTWLRISIALLGMLSILCLQAALNPMFAQTDNRSGSAGATELLIPVGAKSVGLAGAIGASVSGAEAMYWNPAGLARAANPEIMASTMSYIADIQMHNVAGAIEISKFGVFGLAFQSMDFGDIPLTTNDDPEGRLGRSYSPTFFVGALSWARSLNERVFIGAGLKYIHEEIVQSLASGVAFDLGLQIHTPFDVWLGLSVRNFGPNLRFSGNSLDSDQSDVQTEIKTAEFELPTMFDLSIAGDVELSPMNELRWMLSYAQHSFQSDDLHLGLEYAFRAQFFLRSGYEYDLEQDEHSVYSSSFALGCGVRYAVQTTHVEFDYAYRSARYFSGNHVFTLKLML